MSKDIKPDSLNVIHPEFDAESFPLGGGAAYMFFEEDGVQKLAVEDGTDWIDFEESELIGGSETIVRAWGIPVSETDAKDGLRKPVELVVDDECVCGWFFASIGHRVERITAEFPGKMRLRLTLHVSDITEETEECNTQIILDTKLATEADLERPE